MSLSSKKFSATASTKLLHGQKISFASTTVECDYAIEREGEQVVLIECKRAGVSLSKPGQLGTYLERKSTAKIGIYTDGAKYHIYATHIEDNIKHMDAKPLLSFDFRQEAALLEVAEAVRFLTKDSFSPEDLREWARRHESAQAIQEALRKELAEPSEEIIQLLADRAGIGNLNNGDIELLKTAVRQAVNQLPSQYSVDMPVPVTTDSALKHCSRCGNDKEHSEFYKNKNAKDSLSGWCKACRLAYRKEKVAAGNQSSADSLNSTLGSDQEIRWRYKEQEYHAILLQGGGVRLPDGRTTKTPSGACKAVVGQNLAINGWKAWRHYDEQQGTWIPISTLRTTPS